MKRKLSLFLAVAMAFSSTTVVSAKDFNDTSKSWASEAIDRWSDNGVLGGYTDGSFKPQSNITRAEFLSIVDKIMQYQTTGSNTFSDMTGSEWYANSVLNNAAAGNIGTSGTINAKEYITRGEVATILCKALEINPVEGVTIFADDSSISADAKGYINALQNKGFVSGREGNKFDANAPITRAEIASILDKVIKSMYTKAGTYTGNIAGNVVINSKDVVLKDTTIEGDLFVAAGVGEGDLTLENVTVTGDVIVEGGGAHSVKFTRGSKAKKVKMQKNSKERVRLFVDKDAVVGTVVTDSTAPVLVEGEGTIETVIVNGENEIIVGENTTVGTLEVNGGGTITNNGEIGEVVVNEDAGETTIEGTGTIEVVNCKNDKSTFLSKIEKLIVHNPNAQITISDLVKAILDQLGKDFSDKVHFEKSDNADKDKDKDKNKDDDKNDDKNDNKWFDDDDDDDDWAPHIVNVKVDTTTSGAVVVTYNSNQRGTVDYEFMVDDVVKTDVSLYEQTLTTGKNTAIFENLDSTETYTLRITAKNSRGEKRTTSTTIIGNDYIKELDFTAKYLGRSAETASVRVINVADINTEVYYLVTPKATSGSAVIVEATSDSEVNVEDETTSGSAVTVEDVLANGTSKPFTKGSNYTVLEIPVLDKNAYDVYIVVKNDFGTSKVKTVIIPESSTDTVVPTLTSFNFSSVKGTSVEYKYSLSETAKVYTVIASDSAKANVPTETDAIKKLVMSSTGNTSDMVLSYNSTILNATTTRSNLKTNTNYTIFMVAEDYAGNTSIIYTKEFKTLAQ